jgi:hypothetical protein
LIKESFEDGNIEEMLELVFSNEKHYNNMMVFLSGNEELDKN